MDIIKIHELPQGTSINEGYELPVSTGVNPGDVKRFSFALLKVWILSFVTPLITGITQGPAGPAGTPGAQGIQGAKGDKGDKGDAGAQGVKGNSGAAGPIGIQGAKGDKGDKGDTGAQGTQGIKGDQGNQGPPGVDGGGFDMTAYIAAAPVCENEAEALAADLDSYTLYKTSTGELRYKLPGSLSRFTNHFTNQFS